MRIAVIGYLIFEGQDRHEFRSEEAGRVGISPEWIEIVGVENSEAEEALRRLNGEFVMLYGRFEEPLNPNRGIVSGYLRDITAVIA